MITGERKKRNDSFARRLASRSANYIRSALLKDQTRDTGCSLKLFQRKDYINLPYFDHMHRFLPALMLRDNVKLIREDATGKREIMLLDLTKSDLILSPYFYLQQNDILYVTPNKTKAKNSDIGNTTTTVISATSILVSIASLLVNILR